MAVAIGTMNGIGTHGWWQDDGKADVMTEPGTLGFWGEYISSGTFTPGVSVKTAIRIMRRRDKK
jgi:hypothetical protein